MPYRLGLIKPTATPPTRSQANSITSAKILPKHEIVMPKSPEKSRSSRPCWPTFNLAHRRLAIASIPRHTNALRAPTTTVSAAQGRVSFFGHWYQHRCAGGGMRLRNMPEQRSSQQPHAHKRGDWTPQRHARNRHNARFAVPAFARAITSTMYMVLMMSGRYASPPESRCLPTAKNAWNLAFARHSTTRLKR